MFAQSLEITLNLAYNKAKTNRHEFLTVEHLLLSLLDNPDSIEVLSACGANIQRLRSAISDYIEETTPIISAKQRKDTQPTLGFQRVLQRAIFQVQSSGSKEVNGANVLTAIFNEHDSQAVHFLNQESFTKLDVINYLNHGKYKIEDNNDYNFQNNDPGVEISEEESMLDKYTVNLVKKAMAGEIDEVIGREAEIRRATEVLARRKKNNPLFVGEAGVGKTAIAEGLAYLIAKDKCPKSLRNATIYNLDIGVLVAGTKYRGDFEKRFYAVLKELKKIDNAIIFIDEIHSLIGAGAASGGSLDAANLLKPLLSNGTIKCMGATTYPEYLNIFSKDKALSRRFCKIDITEPGIDECIKIIQGIKSTYENFHNVTISDCAIQSAVVLSNKYIADKHLPDKAIDVIDEVCASVNTSSRNERKIVEADVEVMVAKMARIPQKNVSCSDTKALLHLDRDISTMVFGQDTAIKQVTKAIRISRSGLRKDHKPIGSFLFNGPTGVGKTEVAVQLANTLNIKLLRFDMSEYMEKHSASQLIGAPPGYVGFEQGGLLADAVIKNPHAVLLLDEIEKAHSEIFNLLLQVMDNATLTDNAGREIDFRNIIIIMTSNTGARCISQNSMGFSEQDHYSDCMLEVKNQFSPEFINRLDKIVQFNELTNECILKIVDKFITELEVQLDDKHVNLKISNAAKKWLCENGVDDHMGARPMERLIQESIKAKLADEILFGRLAKGGSANIVMDKQHHVILKVKDKEAA